MEWHKLYNSTRWRKYRLIFLAANPLCVDPYKDHGKRPVMATVVDHIRAHRGSYPLFWAPWNHQALCHGCNSKKAVLEEGAFGIRI